MSKRRRPRPYITLFNTYVRNTEPKEYIYLAEAEVRRLPKPISLLLSETYLNLFPKVNISTKALKHIYDDHIAYSPDIIKQLSVIIGSPDAVYENKTGGAGAYIFSATKDGRIYCAVVDVIGNKDIHRMEVRTAFYTSKPRRYLGKLRCVWKNVSRFVEPGGQHTPPS